MSRGRGPRAGRPPPEGTNVTYRGLAAATKCGFVLGSRGCAMRVWTNSSPSTPTGSRALSRVSTGSCSAATCHSSVATPWPASSAPWRRALGVCGQGAAHARSVLLRRSSSEPAGPTASQNTSCAVIEVTRNPARREDSTVVRGRPAGAREREPAAAPARPSPLRGAPGGVGLYVSYDPTPSPGPGGGT